MADTRLQHVQVGEILFKARVPMERCRTCGEGYVHLDALRAADLAIAAEIARRGPASGDAFRFMRQAVRIPAQEIATLLDVSAGTLSRWENGARPVDRAAWATLGAIVLDRLARSSSTLDRLRAARRGRGAKTVRVEATDAP